ncbi:MAG: sn-glycerol-3-phosphate ABC transporter ATP-binding protein UgpC [Propionivibrio sp.]
MATVGIQGVTKSFGNQTVIHHVDLDIEDGEFVTLVGPSGCGKSTLLRMVAGLERQTGGDIRIGERVVNKVPPKERDIAMVFQNYALYPHLTVEDNMGFALRLQGVDAESTKTQVHKAAEILHLEPLLGRFPKQLSGGQRQRVAMGRAIVRNPQVFLFDEPLSNLDAKLRVAMRAEIKELHQRLRTTTIYVTHDQIEAMTMADKIVVMRAGRVEQIGKPLDLYDRPANTFVATFIGSPAMNLFEGHVVREGGRLEFQTNGGIRLPLPQNPAVEAARVYGVRPEHLSICGEGGDDGFEAEVLVVEPTGAETHVVARFGAQDVVCVFHDRLAISPGDIVRLRADLEDVHLFGQDGNRIGR